MSPEPDSAASAARLSDMPEITTEDSRPVFNGMAASPLLSGEVTLTVDREGLLLDTTFDRAVIRYAEIESIRFSDYAVDIRTDLTTLHLSRLGQSAEWFHDALRKAYNGKVLQCFKITESPYFEAAGRVTSGTSDSTATIQVFKDCLCYLPPDKTARRLPFAFMSGLQTDDYRLTIHMADKEHAVFSMLGRELEPLETAIREGVKAMRERNVSFIQRLAPELGFAESEAAARVLHEGLAAEQNQLPASLAAVIERIIRNSKMADTWGELTKIADLSSMAAGIRRMPETGYLMLKEQRLAASDKAELSRAEEDGIAWMVWIVLPSQDKKKAMVEFAIPGEDAATYLFHTNGDFSRFLIQLNRALEASDLQREFFTLSDDDLKSSRFENARMFIDRTPVILQLRQQFAGRIVHRSLASWTEAVQSHLHR